ncbi:MAG: sigma factor-like helix-turn-helix DNA-binding protein [Pyrobaculum sp.]
MDTTQVDLMARMYSKGMTLEEIAKVAGVSSATVRRYLKRAGVQLRRGTRPKRPQVVCPKCGIQGRIHVAKHGVKTHVYVKHPAAGRYKYCHLGTLERVKQQHLDIAKFL